MVDTPERGPEIGKVVDDGVFVPDGSEVVIPLLEEQLPVGEGLDIDRLPPHVNVARLRRVSGWRPPAGV